MDYKNLYQLLIMEILSAQDSDNNINNNSIKFFEKYPNIESLSNATFDAIKNYLTTIINYKNKS